jgi:hypothetical protein
VEFQEIRMYIALLAQLTTIIAFLGISLKPIRSIIKKWIGDIFTDGIRQDMNTGIKNLTQELIKERGLNTRRHKENRRGIDRISENIQSINTRMDIHEEGHP